MNSHIIAQGVTETLTNGTVLDTANTPVLLLLARTDVVVTSIVYTFPPTTPGTGHVDGGFTIPAGSYEFNIKAIVFTGTATLTYRHKAK